MSVVKDAKSAVIKVGNKFPYLTWILVLIVFWAATTAVYHYEKKQQYPEQISERITHDIRQRKEQLYKDRKAGVFEAFYHNAISANTFTAYALVLLEGDELISWTNNHIDPPGELIENPQQLKEGKLMQIGYGVYYVQHWPVHLQQVSNAKPVIALTFIPVAFNYPVENKFFQSDFVADSRIKWTDVKLLPPETTHVTVYSQRGRPLFSLQFMTDLVQTFKAGVLSWIGLIMTSLWLFAWVHRCCNYITFRFKPIYGWLCLVVFCLAFIMSFPYLLPSGFLNNKVFGPEIFASEYIPSFGMLYLFVAFFTWILLYFILNVSLKEIRLLTHKRADLVLKMILVLVLIVLVYAIHYAIAYRMVMDSKISFEVGDFSQLSLYTFIGLYIIVLATFNLVTMLVFIDRLLQSIYPGKLFRYGVFLAVSLLFTFLFASEEYTIYYLIMIGVSLICLMFINSIGIPIYLNVSSIPFSNSPRNYIWFAWFCALVAMEIFYFNYSKEKQLRQIYAAKQAQLDDAQLAVSYFQLRSSLAGDTVVHYYLTQPNNAGMELLHQHLLQQYFKKEQSKYQINTYFFDTNWREVAARDTVGESLLQYAKSNKLPIDSGFIALPDSSDYDGLYFGLTPVYGKDTTVIIGHVGIELAMAASKLANHRANLWGKAYNATDQQYFDQYSFGVYRKGDIIYRGGSRILPYRMNQPGLKVGDFNFKESWQNSLLTYRTATDEWVLVNYKRNLFINIISLFSYVLAIVFFLYLMVKAYNFTKLNSPKARSRIWAFNLTIRTKVNLAILSAVFVALFMVGLVTISVISRKYQEDELRRIRSIQAMYEQDILVYIDAHIATIAMSSKMDAGLIKLMEYMAAQNGIDAHFFNTDGKMIGTSRPDLVQNGLLTNLMNATVLATFHTLVQPDKLVMEKMGNLNYKSMYAPVRTKQDRIVGYMQIPYFDMGANLDKGLSNILVALINMYTLVFFLSGLASIFISNSVIRSFRLLINQFRTIRLKHNEIIHWPYRDEVGLLVNEYNIMIRKVEDMAFRLARTEREDAWRDIAQQVAHEIKNPLTPMKLQIQFLQQALRDQHPNVTQLTLNTAKSLIEQIENLNVIATEFSNFAKMPDPRPETFSLHDTLENIIDIFRKTETVRVFMISDTPSITVYMDKGFFIRIFNNLVKNAIQAIPAGREGLVEINCKALDESSIQIYVKDNGTGMDQETAKKIFVPYFTSKSSGTGIGLAMSKHMVDISGGRIYFESTLYAGTTFFVELPRHQVNGGGAE